MDERLMEILDKAKKENFEVTVLTGAGISAESGIPTFRGQDGYWTKGSKVYQPEELVTWRVFQQDPYNMWLWYLARRRDCAKAQPNPGHYAIAELEKMLGDHFCLVTQNIDGLHLRAGNSLQRTYQIHGTFASMRCSKECCTKVYSIPDELMEIDEKNPLTKQQQNLLVCPSCGAVTRPHILLFDECYNEEFYYYESSIRRLTKTDMLIVIGTSGATTLANILGQLACRKNCVMLDINPESNPFRHMTYSVQYGHYVTMPSGKILPEIIAYWKQ